MHRLEIIFLEVDIMKINVILLSGRLSGTNSWASYPKGMAPYGILKKVHVSNKNPRFSLC